MLLTATFSFVDVVAVLPTLLLSLALCIIVRGEVVVATEFYNLVGFV